MGALSVILGVFAVLTGLRLFNRFRPVSDQAPAVLLSVGADAVNDVGLHQATYQAVLAGQGARVLEVTPRSRRSPAELLDGVDALVLTGGGDVDPALYGGQGGAFLVDPRRDAFERELLREAVRRDMPVLAVCRGIQVMNVAYGGTLRDLRAEPELARTHGITARSLVAHRVDYAPGSIVHAAAGRDSDLVSSFHGQAVGQVGAGLVATAVAPDGVVEALEVPGARFAVGVQWHPEIAGLVDPASRRLFERLLEEAVRRAEEDGRCSS